MIILTNRNTFIPLGEEKIGFVGDNKIETRQFEITDPALFDFDFKIIK